MLQEIRYIYPSLFLISVFVGDEQFFFSNPSFTDLNCMEIVQFSVNNVPLKIKVSERFKILFYANSLFAAYAYVVSNPCSKNIFNPLVRISWIRKSAYSPASAMKSQIGSRFIA